MNITQIIQAMTATVEAPHCHLIKTWKAIDFAADKQQVERHWHENSRMLWLIRECGTHLCVLGVHPRLHEEAFAVIKSYAQDPTKGRLDCFLLTANGIRKVTMDQACQEMSKFDYLVNDDQIMLSDGTELACFDIKLVNEGNRLLGDVRFHGNTHDMLPQRQQLLALQLIAQCEVTNAWNSLFTNTRKVTLNSKCLQVLLQTTQELECV